MASQTAPFAKGISLSLSLSLSIYIYIYMISLGFPNVSCGLEGGPTATYSLTYMYYNLLENLTVVSKIKQLSSIIWKIIPSRCNIDIILHRTYIFRHRTIIFNKESKGAAFGRAPQGRGAPLCMLSLLNMIILCLNM